MKKLSLAVLGVLAAALCPWTPCASAAEPAPVLPQRPLIAKRGTLGLDLCETSPFVFKGKVYRLEWFRNGSHLRIMDRDTNLEVSRFGAKHRFPCAYVEGDTVYVVGTKEDRGWFGNTLTVFTSRDLVHWVDQVAFQDKDYGICNTSICKADGRYVMSIEVNSASKESNGTFAGRYLESRDLIHWTLAPRECRHGFDGGLNSPHFIRWHKGWFYLFSTVGGHAKGYVLMLDRSRDLKAWEASPFNPVMVASEEDKLVLNPLLTEQDRADIAKNGDRNNSDIDFCEFEGGLVINYCWGTQGGPGHEYVAEAAYAGTEGQFLEGWFPDMGEWAGIDLAQPPSTFLRRRAEFGRVLSATGATVTVSSGGKGDLQKLVGGSCPRPYAFHTGGEANPWVEIDLGREATLTGVLVRNRSDCCQERAENLRLQVSRDGRQWRGVWKAAGVEPLWEVPLLGQGVKARHLRLDTRPAAPAPFHLLHVEVWGME